MDRSQFLKAGTCACAMMFLGGTTSVCGAQDESDPPQTDDEKRKKEEADEHQKFITDWMEQLVQTLDKTVDEKTRTRIMQSCGAKCAERTYLPHVADLKGDLDALLARMKLGFAETAEFDLDTGIVHFKGKKLKSCVCPLMKGRAKLPTKTFCLCSTGWMKEVFETVTGAQAEVKMVNSILTGSDHCAFTIALT